jgi:hypothetical protein
MHPGTRRQRPTVAQRRPKCRPTSHLRPLRARPPNRTPVRPVRASSYLRARRWDAVLSAVTVLLMAPTCSYRYGLDQALYHYFGAGWLEGHVPYRDAFDVKPPALFATYALVIRCFGRGQWGIHVAEILCVLATGWAAAYAVTRARARVDGLAGLSALLLAAFYVTEFGFGDTGQAELWQGASVVAAYAVLAREGSRRVNALVAGVFAGVAVLYKIPAALSVVPLVVVVALERPGERRERLREVAVSVAGFVAGVAAPVVLTVSYFWAKGALSDLMEWFFYLPHYARVPLDAEWVKATGPELLLARSGSWLGVFAAIAAAGYLGVPSTVAEPRARHGAGPAALLVSAALGIVVQRRYFQYHAAVLGPFLALVAAHAIAPVLRRGVRAPAAAVLGVVGGGLLSSPVWSTSELGSYRAYVLHGAIPRLLGKLPDAALFAAFVGPNDYSYAAHEQLAALVRSRGPRRGDRIHLRGYETTTYVLTGMYSPSRFLMEGPVLDRYLGAYRPAWRAEHERLLREHPPRFFVTHVGKREELSTLRAAGYGLVGSRENLVLLELGASSVPLSGAEASLRLVGARLRGTVLGTMAFDVTLAEGGKVAGRVAGARVSGRFRMERDSLCVNLRGVGEHCAAVHALGSDLVLFDADSRELARVTSVSRRA